MSDTDITTRCVLSLTLSLYEDGNVEVYSQTWDMKNALGRQNYLLTERERFALLSLIHDELEKYASENQRSATALHSQSILSNTAHTALPAPHSIPTMPTIRLPDVVRR